MDFSGGIQNEGAEISIYATHKLETVQIYSRMISPIILGSIIQTPGDLVLARLIWRSDGMRDAGESMQQLGNVP